MHFIRRIFEKKAVPRHYPIAVVLVPEYLLPHERLRVAHCSAHCLLHVGWKTPVNDICLASHYLDILSAARNQDRRPFWLVDMTGCPWPGPEHWHWLREPYARFAAHVLRQPLFVAFVLNPAHYPHASALLAEEAFGNSVYYDVYPCSFVNEADARDWLKQQQVFGMQPDTYRASPSQQQLSFVG